MAATPRILVVLEGGVVQAVGRQPNDIPRRWWESAVVFVFFTGASGAGKSTLLRLVYMAEMPSEGEVRVGVLADRLGRAGGRVGAQDPHHGLPAVLHDDQQPGGNGLHARSAGLRGVEAGEGASAGHPTRSIAEPLAWFTPRAAASLPAAARSADRRHSPATRAQ